MTWCDPEVLCFGLLYAAPCGLWFFSVLNDCPCSHAFAGSGGVNKKRHANAVTEKEETQGCADKVPTTRLLTKQGRLLF